MVDWYFVHTLLNSVVMSYLITVHESQEQRTFYNGESQSVVGCLIVKAVFTVSATQTLRELLDLALETLDISSDVK